MATPATTDEFLDLVRKSGVLDEKRLDAYLERSRAITQLPAAPEELAKCLVRDALLTRFQAEQLLMGKWRKFTIGKYKVLERLGQGGMGSVYLCEHKLMRRRVAVKVLPTAKADDPASLERFYREARAVAALDHPNIVRAYDIDQDEKLHFLVMEYVDGASLQEIVKRSGPLNYRRAAHYVQQSAFGLQHAHDAAGLVHRDIKPGNILVDRTGAVKVLDMGLARFFNDEEDILTKKYDENVLGTADYLAPEQALDSHGVDIRADIYSLGATFYFCLTGKTPFQEGTVAQKLIWHQTRQPKSIRSFRDDVPEGLLAVIDKMMAKEPAQRYQAPREVAEALAPWTQTPIGPPPEEEMPQLSPAALGVSTADTTVATPVTPTPPLPRRSGAYPLPANPRTPAAKTPPAKPKAPSVAVPPAGPRKSTAEAPRAPTPAPNSGTAPTVVSSNNGQPRQSGVAAAVKPAAVPPAPAAPPPAEPEEEPAQWDRIAAEMTQRPGSSIRTRRKGPGSSITQAATLSKLATLDRRTLWIAGAVGGVILLGLVVALVLWASSGKPAGQRSGPGEPGGGRAPLIVEPGQQLLHVLGRAKVGDRIIVRGDPTGIHEEGMLRLEGGRIPKDLTIDCDGKAVVWRPEAKSKDTQFLIAVSNTEGLKLTGFTFDGLGRMSELIQIQGRCPGTELEDLRLQGYKERAVHVYSCEGDKDRPVVLRGLHVNGKEGEAGVVVEVKPNMLPGRTSNVTVSACQFEGAFGKSPIVTRVPPGATPLQDVFFSANQHHPAADKPWAKVEPLADIQAAAPVK